MLLLGDFEKSNQLGGGEERAPLAQPARHRRRAARPGRCTCWPTRLVELEVVDTISHETIRRVLKKTKSSRG